MTMKLSYKDDWEEAAGRLRAWWGRAGVDRPAIQVTAPRDRRDAAPSGWTGWNFVHDLDDPDRAIDTFEAWAESAWFGGEAFPNLWINYGPGVMAAFLGVEPVVAEDTVWFESGYAWDEIALMLEPKRDNTWWLRVEAATRRAAERGRGRWVTSMTDLGGELDVLASLRGAERLLTDLVDCPDRVECALARLNELWWRFYAEIDAAIRPDQDGTSSWMGVWGPGTSYPLQCDFAAMISPAMFERFVVPHLQSQCRRLDHSIYHLDGPGELPHLDSLLRIPELDGIQWIPGAGQPGVGSPVWFPMYRRILEAGKLLALQWMPPEDVEGVVRAFPAQGVLITTGCGSEAEGRELLGKTESWARG